MKPHPLSGRHRAGPNQALLLPLLGAALLVGGCATTPSTGVEPTMTPSVPAGWQTPLPGAADPKTNTSDLVSWWQRFNAPALPGLIAAAQEASPTLASAVGRIERARATRIAAGAALLPRVDAVAGGSHGRSQLNMPIATTANAGLQASWEIDLFGANAAGRRAAQARLEGSQAGWHDARISLAAETAQSYASLRACEAQLVQARLDAESRAATSRLTEQSAGAGFTAPADAALVRAGAAQSRSQAVNQRATCDTLLKSLVELTDLPETELRQRLAEATGLLPQPQAIGVDVLPAQLLAQRPDLAEAARNVVAAAADHQRSRARELPQVSLTGSLLGVSARMADVTQSGTTWSIGPLTVSLPLFDLGARGAATTAARASYDEAVAVYRAQVRRAVREVESSLVALQATAEREADARLAAQDFDAALRATEARQRGGLASLLDLENARRNAVQAQIALIDLQRERTAA
ncbi:MAG TPA: efflux transporter outer membrane subunit, partial [Rubrivivax sp.]|nr:efflux transporter outer membrane subunit [Rubrivivax sp.]